MPDVREMLLIQMHIKINCFPNNNKRVSRLFYHAFALQQRVSRHRRAHLDAGHLGGRDRLAGCQSQQATDALHRRIGLLLGMLGQQLGGGQAAIGAAGHDVGEGAATVDPELPFIVWNA